MAVSKWRDQRSLSHAADFVAPRRLTGFGFPKPIDSTFSRRYCPRLSRNLKGHPMTKEELTSWALSNGWQQIADAIVLVRPSKPTDAIVRMVFKATVVQIEIKKPSGKWDKVAGEAYAKVTWDEYAELPTNLGLSTISGLTKLMQDNKDRLTFSKFGG
jgi:hypothetical protein